MCTTLLSGTTGGAAAGGVVAFAGRQLTLDTRVTVATAVATLLAIEPLASPRRLLQFDRETEQSLLGLGPFAWAVANGLLLGFGFTSRIGYWIFYIVPVSCFAVGSPGLGALIWGTYGFTRLGVVSMLALRMHGMPTQMGELSRRFLVLQPSARRLSNPVAALCALCIALVLGL